MATRNVFIRSVGPDRNGNPCARGIIDLDDSESLAFIRAGGKQTSRVTGIVNGLPPAAIGKLNAGDNLVCNDVKVSLGASSYKDSDGNEHPSVDVAIRLAGKVSRTAAQTAECDW